MALKRSSEVIMISDLISVDTSGAFSVREISLPLDILNREVFVVTGVDFQVVSDISFARIDSFGDIRCRLTSTRPTSFLNLSNSNVLATLDYTFSSSFVGGPPAVANFSAHEQLAGNTPPANMDYIGIIATDNCFLSQDLDGNIGLANAAAINCRIYGYRAQADASTYAALVQSEALSQ